jgi:class 3 adenylate cyclase/tetratricopeptide (TPR) repeat protein
LSDPGRASHPLTIMVTDVEGSTDLRRARGDQIADEILRLHEAIVRDQIGRFGGRERKFLGDGFLVSFDSTVPAVRAAAGIERALAEHNAANRQQQVRVRIGLHRGEVPEHRGELSGQVVEAATRIAGEAAGGQILVSDDVRQQAEPELGWEFVDSGLFWLPGFSQRWRLYEVSLGAAAPAARSVAPAVPLTPFVGRDSERASLRRDVDAALGGHGRLGLVAGEAGVGKSRLVAEVGAEAQARGMGVLTGHCVQMDGATPYLPYVEIVEQAISSPRSPLAMREALGDVAPEIARIAPVLRRVFPDIEPPVELPTELARRYLWNSFGEFLLRAAQRRPLLLVLEDLHWADESTVLLTEYLAPLLPQMPVLVLGTYRDDEVDLSHPLSRVISQLGRRRLVDRITLRRLSFGGVRAMVQALAGQPPPEELVRVIDSETEGNPFFVEEVYLHLAESGVLFDERGRVRPDLGAREVSVPQSVRLVVGKRLDQLSAPTRDVLVAAAVSGRVFAPDVVREVTGADPDAMLDAFDEAEGARLVTATTGDGHLAFTHELIRQTLLADLSTMKRERLHLRAADAIERLYADEVDAHAGELAHHLSLAGLSADQARLVRYLTVAGERAADVAAWGDAVARFEHALSVLPAGSEEARAALLERLAMALRSLGRWDDALRRMNEALDVFERLGRTDAVGRLAWAMVYQLTFTVRVPEAVQAAQRALGVLGEVASADRARLLSAMAWAISVGGDHATSTPMFDQARALAEQVGDERALADVLHMQTIHHLGFAEFREGVVTGLRAAEVYERERALWDLCSVQAFVVYEDGTLGSRDQAARLADKALDTAERIGHLGAQFVVLADGIRDAVRLGDLDAVDLLAPRVVEVCERGGLPWLYVGHLYAGMAAHWRGDSARADADLRRAVELEPPGAFAGQSASILARHLAHTGRGEEVRALYETARPTLPSVDGVHPIGRWNTLFGLLEALWLSGFRDEAAALSPLMEHAVASLEQCITFDTRLIRTRAAVAAAADGRYDDAERHFDTATQEAQRLEFRLELTDLRRLRALVLLDRGGPGDGTRAAELLGEAAADYRRFGMPTYVGEAERLLRRARERAQTLGG